MTYSAVILSRADRALDKLHPGEQEKVSLAIESLASQPRPHNALKLKDRRGWRLRVGDYRIIYEIIDRTHTIIVLEIGHRREIYR